MAKYVIDFDRVEVYEAGAVLLTLLACPGAKDTDEVRGGFHATLCSLALQAQAVIDPEWARSPQLIKPLYLLRSDRDIARDLKLLARGLRDRAVAAALLQKWSQRVAANMRRWANANSRSDTRSETGPSIIGRWSVEGG